MNLGIKSFRKIELNPELEALRIKGLQENAVQANDWILQLIKKTIQIHAAFLFEDLKTLQKLCLYIVETSNKITDAGWEAFGYHLGLSPIILKVINHNNFNKEDPCYNVLLAYVQHENASIGKALKALYDMGRLDVLNRIKDSINDLADIILSRHNNFVSCNSEESTSDYDSLISLGDNEQCNNRSYQGNNFLKPKIIPPAPFIFQNIKANSEYTSQYMLNHLINRESSNSSPWSQIEKCGEIENFNIIKVACSDSSIADFNTKALCQNLQNSSYTHLKNGNFKAKEKKYGIKILLTFAEDGEKFVDEICKTLRKKRENYSSIGVLVLSEHIDIVNKDPLQFISGAFYQVDYVCPILTQGYFRLITKKEKTSFSNIHIDAQYVPYIYILMNAYFVSNDCLNDKFRCIIPESELTFLTSNLLFTNPIFGAWVKLSEISELAERLLRSNAKKCFNKVV